MKCNCDYNNLDLINNNLLIKFKSQIIYVTLINSIMFFVEWSAGFYSNSQSLKADSLDFLADAINYLLSFMLLFYCIKVRSAVVIIKSIFMISMSFYIIISSFYYFFWQIEQDYFLMGVIGFIALLANLISVIILRQTRFVQDANIQSLWLCSRNDAIGNALIIITSYLIYITHQYWLDLMVAIIMSCLFSSTAIKLTKMSILQYKKCNQ